MKKVLFMLAFAGMAMAANAQLILGGQIGFGANSGTDNVNANAPLAAYNAPTGKVMNFTLAPTISYVLNEKMQVGVSLEYTLGSVTNYTPAAYALGKEDWQKLSSTTITIAPYFRYYVANHEKLNFFCEAQLGLGISPRDKGHAYDNTLTPTVDQDIKGGTSTTMLGLVITPGVNYRINDHLSADIYVDLAGLAFIHTATKNYGAVVNGNWDDDFVTDTQVDNYFGLTANASAQTLNAHFGNFRIGFNYHF